MDYLRYLKQIKIFTAVQGMVAIFYPTKFLINIAPQHDALKNGNIENISILLSNVQSIISNKVLLKQQMNNSNKSGYNCLHQVVESGNIEAIIAFIRFVRDNFEHDSAAIQMT